MINDRLVCASCSTAKTAHGLSLPIAESLDDARQLRRFNRQMSSAERLELNLIEIVAALDAQDTAVASAVQEFLASAPPPTRMSQGTDRVVVQESNWWREEKVEWRRCLIDVHVLLYYLGDRENGTRSTAVYVTSGGRVVMSPPGDVFGDNNELLPPSQHIEQAHAGWARADPSRRSCLPCTWAKENRHGEYQFEGPHVGRLPKSIFIKERRSGNSADDPEYAPWAVEAIDYTTRAFIDLLAQYLDEPTSRHDFAGEPPRYRN